MTLKAGAPARSTRGSVHQGHDWTNALRPAAPWGSETGKGGSQVQVHSSGTGRAENSCRAPICRNERDRVCRGGGVVEAAGISSSVSGWGARRQIRRSGSRGKVMGRRDHPSHHYHLAGPPSTPLPCTHTHPHNILATRPEPRQGGREPGTGLEGEEGCVREWADGQGRGGTGMRCGRAVWMGWMDQDAVGLFWFLGSPSHAHTCPLRGCRVLLL